MLAFNHSLANFTISVLEDIIEKVLTNILDTFI